MLRKLYGSKIMDYSALESYKVQANTIVFSQKSRDEYWPAVISACPYGQWKSFCTRDGTEKMWVGYFDDYNGAWVSKSSLKTFE